ncbi:MAG: hypothetical protein ACR2PL_07890, partial [Dehalococcoidia bacterium]
SFTHAGVDVARRGVDRVVCGSDGQHLRAKRTAVVQDAALTANLDTVLSQAQKEIGEVSGEHFARLTEEALRRLNKPAALAQCGLIARLPQSLAAGSPPLNGQPQGSTVSDRTPLEQAQLVRETLTRAIERLKPSDTAAGSPGALQYQILNEEYLQGLPNKQIMTRLSISESTFHRNRREAIAILARELGTQEQRLAQRRQPSAVSSELPSVR